MRSLLYSLVSLLSLSLFFGASPAARAGHGFTEVIIPADQVWVATGITVTEGSRFSFFGMGVVESDDDMTDLNRLYDCAGNSGGLAPGGFPIEGYPLNCLIGKVGEAGTPFVVGTSLWHEAMPATGELYLGKNDLAESGDVGAWIVLVRQDPEGMMDHGFTEVVVPGNQAWTASGISVSAGEKMSFLGLGVIDFDADMTDLNRLYGPGGDAPGLAPGGFPAVGFPLFCLLGKIGEGGAPFVIKPSDWARAMPASGDLYLGVNDGDVGDNQGAWIVLVRRDSDLAGLGDQGRVTPGDVPQLGTAPNPLSLSTTLWFSLPTQGDVTLQVFDVSGRLVKTLYAGLTESGVHSAEWDGRDQNGNKVAAGTYFCRVLCGEDGLAEKIVVLR